MSERWTPSDLADYQSRRSGTASKPVEAVSKYRNKKTEVDGLWFDSKKEAARYQELVLLQREGSIKKLQLQVTFILSIKGVRICRYRADFVYYERIVTAGRGRNFHKVVEDCKGIRTPVYRLKKKLMLAIHGIEIRET